MSVENVNEEKIVDEDRMMVDEDQNQVQDQDRMEEEQPADELVNSTWSNDRNSIQRLDYLSRMRRANDQALHQFARRNQPVFRRRLDFGLANTLTGGG